jgi:hypothetical protein
MRESRSRRRPSPLQTILLCVAAGLPAAACGGLPGARSPFPGTEPRASIIIDNFESGYIGMIVFISSTTGGPNRLGSVSTAGSSRFEFRGVRGGEYVLEGRRAGLPTLRSPTFLLGDGDTVEWNLGDNRISYRPPGGAPAVHPVEGSP